MSAAAGLPAFLCSFPSFAGFMGGAPSSSSSLSPRSLADRNISDQGRQSAAGTSAMRSTKCRHGWRKEEMRTSRIQRRVYELLSKAADAHKDGNNNDQKELHFVFFRRPIRFLPSENGSTVGAVQLEKNFLKDNGVSGKQVAVGTGEFEDLKCGLVLKSIGYKSLPVQDLPFDENRGIVPNLRGRVLRCDTVETGLYVVGWLKRGATGIVATNLHCAEETVASILDDDKNGIFTSPVDLKKQGRVGLLEILERKNVRFVPFSGWEKIDSKEKMSGQLTNKPREKITTWDGLLKAANE